MTLAFLDSVAADDELGVTHARLDCSRHVSTPVIECRLTAEALRAHGPPSTQRAVVFADGDVWNRFEARLAPVFRAAYRDLKVVSLPGGEASKCLDSLQGVLAQMAALQILRHGDALYALGGGTVLDLVGFAASIFRRGVPVTKLPTTLLAQVDAAIGLKNAINLGGCKNLVGSFAPPHSVLVDFDFLHTLPARHWSNGIAEIIKLGLMTDATLIRELAVAGQRPAAPEGSVLRDVFRRAITGMVGQLSANAYEELLQRAVDFGHWLSPQLEMVDPGLLHGEAVAIDMAVSMTLAWQRGLVDRDACTRAIDLIAAWGLPLTHPAIEAVLVQDSLDRTARHRGGVQNIPLCAGIGRHAFFSDLTKEEVLTAHARLVSQFSVGERALSAA